MRRHGEGRHQVDDIAERPHPAAAVDETLPDPVHIAQGFQLDHADGALDPHIGDAVDGAAGFQGVGHAGFDGADLLEARLALEQVERGVGGGAGERVAGVGGAVHEAFFQRFVEEGFEQAVRGHRRRQGHGAAGERLGQGHDIGHHVGLLAGEHRSQPAESDHDLVEDQEQAMAVTNLAHEPYRLGIVEHHAASALHQGFHNDRGGAFGVLSDEILEGLALFRRCWQIDHQLRRHQARERPVHDIVGVADGHGADGVAVITVLKSDEFVTAADAAVDPVLHRHFHGQLDGNRTRFGKEHAVQIAGRQGRQPAGQGIGRFV